MDTVTQNCVDQIVVCVDQVYYMVLGLRQLNACGQVMGAVEIEIWQYIYTCR